MVIAKQLETWLIRVALYKVIIDYAKLTPLERACRPLRPPLCQDEATLRALILEFRRRYATEKSGGTEVDFETVKERLLTSWQQKQCWSDESRNLFSSALSTYIGFDRKSKPTVDEKLKEETQLLRVLCELFWEEERKFYGG